MSVLCRKQSSLGRSQIEDEGKGKGKGEGKGEGRGAGEVRSTDGRKSSFIRPGFSKNQAAKTREPPVRK